ncbi:uncharacterized protein LOC116337664 [Contarinia nasturtii]|uniref:uncharacterized protein LOC116337664 n=1 Tax=Contarinia nasturtii TaxID=265458 RepID=UPI0012D42EDD|nr:uncharacterized protein LOC116337664 [Contarinia nasturtii]
MKLSIFAKMASLTSTTAPVQINQKSPRAKTKALGTWIYMIVFLMAINIYNDYIGITMLCNAGPMPTSLVLPPSSSSVNSPTTIRVVNLTRQHGGDIFTAFDESKCDVDTCVGLSSGTAGTNGNDASDIGKHGTNDDCNCQCLPHLDAFREDLNICVDDIHECTLAPFVSGSTSEKIPFVFLPLRGQIIHPSRSLDLNSIKAPICAVSGAQYLTTSGWTELRNAIDLDVPFRLFRDEGRTFLQWLGESDLRFKMQGRLILVSLMCRETIIGIDNDITDRAAMKSVKSTQNIFTPCVAFRVAGMPIKHINNVTEVSFQSESTSSTLASIDGLSAKEYILIAICSLILGLIYVASVFLYIHVKRYKTRTSNNDNDNDGPQRKSEYQQNDEVTFGNGFNRSTYDRSSGSITGGIMPDRHKNLNRNMSLNGLGNEEQGVIKSNPLLKHYPNFSDNSGFISDMSNSNSECGEEHISSHELLKNMQNASHSHSSNSGQMRDGCENTTPSPTQETECLPEENVSIIEDMTTEDKLENMKAIVSGTMRRKLYFNPAYFEPHLLMSPPPAAIEFLSKIREVITLAKYKMASKRFQPSLTMIPEEHLNMYAANGSKSLVQQNMSKGDKKSCAGCSGCANEKAGVNCKNCGEKRNSIRKWLEGVSKHESNILEEGDTDETEQTTEKVEATVISTIEVNNSPSSNAKQNDSGSSSDSDTVKENSLGSKNSKKRKAPPIPSTAPKIISHYLKKDSQQMKPQPERQAPVFKSDINIESNNNNSIVKNTNVNADAIQLKAASLLENTDIYNGLSLLGSEIYNNPQFMLSSPSLSHRSKSGRNSSQSRQSSAKKRFDVLDQYANPAQLIQENMVKNLQNVPDMVYEAITKDFPPQNPANQMYGHLNVPTPDYDDPSSTYSRKRFNSYDNDETLIPPPDYNSNTLGRKQYQPDSPIYHRKSPHYLIVDYETDSLERTNTNKMIRNSITPHSNNSSDLSSQPSPSLSSALPLEEEVEIGNTVYDRVEGYRKDGDPMKVIRNFPKKPKPPSIYEDIGSVSKAYLQSSRSSESSREPRIMYNTPFHGSMTIEVEHEPTDEEISTDSDQFEPDTLDRKPKKFNNTPKMPSERFQDIPNNQRNINDWPNRQYKANEYMNRGKSNKEFMDSNLSSLPDMSYFNNNNNNNDSQVVLRSSGSFKSNSLGNYLSEIGALMNNNDLEKSFSSLREIYEAKNQKNLKQRPGLTENEFDGRILTLEARHSKRQRQTTLDKNMKKILPPDIIPLDSNNIYEVPLNVANIKNNEKNAQKMFALPNDDLTINNKNKRSNNDLIVNSVIDKKMQNVQNIQNIEDDVHFISETLSSSSTSESTDITGISEPQPHSEQNSLKQAYSQVRKTSKCSGVYNLEARRASELQNNPKYMNLSDVHSLRPEQPSDCNSDTSTLKTGSTKFYYKSNLNQEANLNNHFGASEDLDKIEIISSKSLRLKDIDLSTEIIDNTKHLISELANDTSTFNPQLNQMTPTKVFHVDISPPTNGMQIALGIRDRVKKSKDLKHAWKKFVNMATSKFQGGNNATATGHTKTEIRGEYDLVDKMATFTDSTDRDDGIASMSTCDDSITTASSDKQSIEILSRTPSSSSSDMIQKPNKTEMDYGYISADSNESRAQKKNLYARFNFKMDKNCPEPSTSKAALCNGSSNDRDWRQRYLHRMQDIKENSESDRNSVSSAKHGPKPQITKPMISAPISATVPSAQLIDFIPKAIPIDKDDAIKVRIYSSSDDDRYSSGMSSESDGEYNADELCESGAESIETHSVFFKNIRKLTDDN